MSVTEAIDWRTLRFGDMISFITAGQQSDGFWDGVRGDMMFLYVRLENGRVKPLSIGCDDPDETAQTIRLQRSCPSGPPVLQ